MLKEYFKKIVGRSSHGKGKNISEDSTEGVSPLTKAKLRLKQQTCRLFDAIGRDDVKECREFLDAGVDIEARHLVFDRETVEPNGWVTKVTPLTWAAMVGEKTALELIARGADVHATDTKGRTPLHQAVWAGQTTIALSLLDHGARTDVRDRKGRTPLEDPTNADSKATIQAILGKEYSLGRAQRVKALAFLRNKKRLAI